MSLYLPITKQPQSVLCTDNQCGTEQAAVLSDVSRHSAEVQSIAFSSSEGDFPSSIRKTLCRPLAHIRYLSYTSWLGTLSKVRIMVCNHQMVRTWACAQLMGSYNLAQGPDLEKWIIFLQFLMLVDSIKHVLKLRLEVRGPTICLGRAAIL